MGNSSYDPTSYYSSVASLKSSGKSFARSATAARSGDYSNIAEHLDPSKLKNGVREACYRDGEDDLLPIAWVLDLTGSMASVPEQLQEQLSTTIETVIEQGISEHPNVMFVAHDDEFSVKNAALQMSQFEAGAEEIINATNEMIVTGMGGGNMGEAYHLAAYALANHTRLETFERHGDKGFAIFVCDEPPYYDNGDWRVLGTKPEVANAIFGDGLQAEVPMLETMKKLAEKYHIIVIRPSNTFHGKDRAITKEWQDLLEAAGENPQNVIEVENTDAIITTATMAIGTMQGIDQSDLVDVLKSKGAVGVDAATAATKSLVATESSKAVASANSDIDTGSSGSRERL